ncbi:MAG: hypothetical protein R3E12_17960 [Candidatus Eisenbacteria bacterium]
MGSFVVIDYPHQRFALLRPGAVPLWLWQQTIWTPATLRDAKLFPYLCLGDTTTPALFFDTGSSAFDLVMDREDWDGLRDPDATPSNVDGSSWGQEITIVGAPARGPLSIGSIRLDTPMVYYIAQSPTMFSSWPFPTDGLVGNSPFWDRVVILDLGIRPRFGILAAEQ